MANTELRLEVAIRDQVIQRQREAQRNLWKLLSGLGLQEKQMLDFAAWHEIPIEDYMMSPYLCDKNHPPNPSFLGNDPLSQSEVSSLSYSRRSSCNFEQYHQSIDRGGGSNWNSFSREEHHTYYFLSNDHHSPPSAQPRMKKPEQSWFPDSSTPGGDDQHEVSKQ